MLVLNTTKLSDNLLNFKKKKWYFWFRGVNERQSFTNIGLRPLLFVIGDTRSFVSRVTAFLFHFFPSFTLLLCLSTFSKISTASATTFSQWPTHSFMGRKRNKKIKTDRRQLKHPKIVKRLIQSNYFHRSFDPSSFETKSIHASSR